MVEEAPAQATAKPVKKAKPKRTGPSTRDLIIKVFSENPSRGGLSLAGLKKGLKALGYDTDKFKARIRITVRTLVDKEVLIQIKGTGASGSFRLNKKGDTKSKKAAAKKTAPKDKKLTAKKTPASKKTAAKKPAAVKKADKPAKSPRKPAKSQKKPAKSQKKSPAKKAPAKKAPAKKAPAKKAPAKKSPAKKTPAKKVTKPKPAKKTASKKK